MKYFVYASRTKVDMLFEQIEPGFLGGLSAQLRADLGIVSASVSTGNAPACDSLYCRIEVLDRYLESAGKLGGLDGSKPYVHATVPCKIGIVWEYAASIFFCGTVIDGRKVGFIGSKDSVVGAVPSQETKLAPFYYTLRFMEEVAASRRTDATDTPYMTLEEAIDLALRNTPVDEHSVSVTARVLHRDARILLATPLYVAYAD